MIIGGSSSASMSFGGTVGGSSSDFTIVGDGGAAASTPTVGDSIALVPTPTPMTLATGATAAAAAPSAAAALAPTALIGGSGSSYVDALVAAVASPLGGVSAGGGATTIAGAGAGMSGVVSAERRRQLLDGAQAQNATERSWLAEAAPLMQAYNSTRQQLEAEAARQAALGRDINGQPLQRAEDHVYEQRVIDLVNVERARYGLTPLVYNRQLDAASENHNAQQVATRTMAHSGIGDADPGTRIRAQGYNRSWGENVATGQLSPEQVVTEWMASPGHRRNILDPAYREIGVSYATAADGRSYWAQSFGG